MKMGDRTFIDGLNRFTILDDGRKIPDELGKHLSELYDEYLEECHIKKKP